MCVCIMPARAQDPSIVDTLIGEWEGQGELFGIPAAFQMKWEWALEKKFLHLTFQNSFRRANSAKQTLQAQAFYRPQGNDSLSGTWFDSRGMVLPLEASIEGALVNTLWGTPEIEQGRTEYHIMGPTQIEVKDFVLRDGVWHQFGQATYRRL